MHRGWLLIVFLSACTGGSSSTDAAPAKAPCESLDAYCARNRCVRDGVRAYSDFATWCRRVGPFDDHYGGTSTCGNYVMFDARIGDTSTQHWYDSATGKLVWVFDWRADATTCAGVEPDRSCAQSGVGMGCTANDAGIPD
jgi:hypothetical protein